MPIGGTIAIEAHGRELQFSMANLLLSLLSLLGSIESKVSHHSILQQSDYLLRFHNLKLIFN